MGLLHRIRVHGRKAALRRAINTYRHVRVAWQHELSHIERTGRLDWVDPHPIRIHPASDVLKPPPPQPRGRF